MELKIDNAAVEKLVIEQIKITLAEVLGKNTDVLVSKLVDDALRQPDPRGNSWNRESQVTAIVRDMIQNAAKESVQEWLDAEKPKVKKLVFAALAKQSNGLVAQVVDAMVAGLGKGLDVSVWLKAKD